MPEFDPSKLIENRIYGNGINEKIGQVHMATITENENNYCPLYTKYYIKAT